MLKMQTIDLTFEEANEPAKESTNNTQKQHNEDWMFEGINRIKRERKERYEKILNSKSGKTTKAIELYKIGLPVDNIVRILGLVKRGVEKLVGDIQRDKGIETEDLTYKTLKENQDYSHNLVDMIENTDKYPNLKYLLGIHSGILGGILCSGSLHKTPKLDIAISWLGTIIINTKSEAEKEEWLKRIGNFDAFLECLGRLSCRRFFFAHEGIYTILSVLEEDAKSHVEDGAICQFIASTDFWDE